MNKGIDFIGNSVVYFCHDGNGKFLMQKRGQNCRDDRNRWDIGAGGVEVADSIEETLKKEIKEEYCTEVVSYEFLGYRDVFRVNEDGQKTHWIALDFKVLVKPDLAANGEPHKFDEIGWFTLNSMPSPMHSQLPVFLEKYKDRL